MKKIVHYDNSRDFMIQHGSSAFVYPVDHPDDMRVSNTKLIRTTAVQSYEKDTGEFETLNTIYRPVTALLKGL